MALDQVRALMNQGISYELASKLAALTTVGAANAGATYTAAEQTLVNELKTDVNVLVNAFK